MLTVRHATPVELAEWDDLVYQFPNGRIVHTRAWLEWLEASGHGRALYLVVERDTDVVACVPGLLHSVGFVRLFGSPPPGSQTPAMGPAFDRERVSTETLVAALVPYLERQHHVHHLELMTTDFDPPVMRALGFHGQQEPTHRTPLVPGDPARQFKAWKESARRNVRRAEKLGLIARFEDDERFVEEHYAQIREVFIRGGHTVSFSRRKTLEFFRRMRAAGRLLAISVYLPDGETSIASALFTMDGKELLLWSWAHHTAYRWYRPTEFLMWHVLHRAMDAGCNTCDLMGVGEFKRKFGGALETSKYRWTRSRYRWLALARDLAQWAYRWQQALRGRLARVQSPVPHRTDAESDDTETRPDGGPEAPGVAVGIGAPGASGTTGGALLTNAINRISPVSLPRPESGV